MRPYDTRGNGYVMRNREQTLVRPTRGAAGLSYNIFRQRARGKSGFGGGDLLRLSVYGTLDSLAGGCLRFKTIHKPCPCCGHKPGGKLALNDGGRLRLRLLLKRAERN